MFKDYTCDVDVFVRGSWAPLLRRAPLINCPLRAIADLSEIEKVSFRRTVWAPDGSRLFVQHFTPIEHPKG